MGMREIHEKSERGLGVVFERSAQRGSWAREVRPLLQQHMWLDTQRLGDLRQHQHGRIAHAAFDA